MAKVRNSLAAGTALMAVALMFTGQFESAGGKPHLDAYLDVRPGNSVTDGNHAALVAVCSQMRLASGRLESPGEQQRHGH